eukprot:11184209-Lingulodinium_polyedra.AAC.1
MAQKRVAKGHGKGIFYSGDGGDGAQDDSLGDGQPASGNVDAGVGQGPTEEGQEQWWMGATWSLARERAQGRSAPRAAPRASVGKPSYYAALDNDPQEEPNCAE